MQLCFLQDVPEVLAKADIELMGGVYRVVFQVYIDKVRLCTF